MATEVSKCTYLYDKGETIIEEGDEHHNEVFILQSGVLAVLKSGVKFSSITQPTAVFGEMSVILDCPRTSSVRAETPSVITKIPFNNIESAFKNNPNFAKWMTLGLANRLKEMNNAYQELLLHNAQMRSEISELNALLRNT